MEEGCWVSGVSKNGIVGAQGGPTLFGSHCTGNRSRSFGGKTRRGAVTALESTRARAR